VLRNKDDNYKNCTYIGSTNNPNRRIRQHNSIIKGGAKYTKARGYKWEMFILLSGHMTHSNVLSCEWKMKHLKKKYNGQINKVKSLNELLQLDKWTSKCDINNFDCVYNLYVVEDMKEYFIFDNIPNNINLHFVEKIDKEFIDIISLTDTIIV
jgi:structure-specific endonuclease subunit SLX1